MLQYAFYILAALSVLSAVMVVFSKKPVHSVLYLIFCFFTVAGHYILLNAQFLAIVHVIVYAGAIMVLFLFVVMLLNLNAEIEPHKPVMMKFAAVIAGGCLLILLIGTLKGSAEIPLTTVSEDLGYVRNLGVVLYRDYVLPFEIISILFLSAMIGAVMLVKKNIE